MEWTLLAVAFIAVIWLKINYRKTDGPHSWPVTSCLAGLYLVMLFFPIHLTSNSPVIFWVRSGLAALLCWELIAGHFNNFVMSRYAYTLPRERHSKDDGIIWMARFLMPFYAISLWSILSLPTFFQLNRTSQFFFFGFVPVGAAGFLFGLALHALRKRRMAQPEKKEPEKKDA
ncbi:MAG: hypothetical protein HND56_01820 [Pseudomonadota bacterium]|nr:hypothetical protein [Pseudomonadota bacterium]QKK04498.1 MAG: hypothetical protein HND56_01820 [Pseudomonadota bacterium]